MKNLGKVMALAVVLCMALSMVGTVSFATETESTVPTPIFELDLSEYDSKFKGSKFNTTAKNKIEGTDINVDIWMAVNGAYQDGSVTKKTLDAKNGTSTDYLELEAFRPTTRIVSGWAGFNKNYLKVSGADLLVDNATIEFWTRIDDDETRPNASSGNREYTNQMGYYFSQFAPIKEDCAGNTAYYNNSSNAANDGNVSHNEFTVSAARSQLFNFKGLNMKGVWSSTPNSTYYTYGKWAHVVMTRAAKDNGDGTYNQNEAVMKMYIDNVAVTNDGATEVTLTDTSGNEWDKAAFSFGLNLNHMNVGGTADAADALPHTYISGLKIYDEVLSEAEIAGLYNATKDNYDENTVSLSVAGGTKIASGAKTITVTYGGAISDAEARAKLALIATVGSEITPTYTWADDYTSVDITFTAEKSAEYTLTYPVGARTMTATYTVASNIDEMKIFDLEFDAETKTATDTVNNIPVKVQEGEATHSVMTTDTIYAADGTKTDYFKVEKIASTPAVAANKAYSGLYAQSDKFIGDEITVEFWAKISKDNMDDKWTTTFLGIRSLDENDNGANLNSRSIGVATSYGGDSTILGATGAVKGELDKIVKVGTTEYRRHFNKWAQIVMTRKYNRSTNTYTVTLNINAPNGNAISTYTSVEKESSVIASTVPAEASGLLHVAMPYNGMSTTSGNNNMIDTIEVGDVRAYSGIMSAEEALEIYNRDKGKYVDAAPGEMTILNTKLFNGETEIGAVNGVEDIKLTGTVISRVVAGTKLIAALYDDGGETLVAAQIVDISSDDATPLDIQFENDAVSNGFIKLFVWDSLDGLYPYYLDGGYIGAID